MERGSAATYGDHQRTQRDKPHAVLKGRMRLAFKLQDSNARFSPCSVVSDSAVKPIAWNQISPGPPQPASLPVRSPKSSHSQLRQQITKGSRCEMRFGVRWGQGERDGKRREQQCRDRQSYTNQSHECAEERAVTCPPVDYRSIAKG